MALSQKVISRMLGFFLIIIATVLWGYNIFSIFNLNLDSKIWFLPLRWILGMILVYVAVIKIINRRQI